MNYMQFICSFQASSSSKEEDTVNFPLPRANGNANLVRYHVLSGLYQIQQRATELEVIFKTIMNDTEDWDKWLSFQFTS